MWWNYGIGWFIPGLFFLTFFVIFWLFVAFLFWGRWRRWGWHREYHHGAGDGSAEELLANRFARGEIDEDEYNERLEALRRHQQATKVE